MAHPTGAADHDPRPDLLLEIGHLRRPHGLRGDVFVQLLSDDDDRLVPGAVLYTADRSLVVAASRRASNGRRIAHFEGIDDRTAAEAFTNNALFAEPVDDPEALWVHDLVGRRVVDQHGTDHGECVGVIANPAADLLEIAGGALVPSNFVVANVDGVITVDVPPGLFDLE